MERERDRVENNHILALINDKDTDVLPIGIDVAEPVYGAPARWISGADQDAVTMAGVTTVTPAEVLATHLLEVITRNFHRLLTLKALRRLLDEFTRLRICRTTAKDLR